MIIRSFLNAVLSFFDEPAAYVYCKNGRKNICEYPAIFSQDDFFQKFAFLLYLGVSGRIQTLKLRIMGRVFYHCPAGCNLGPML